MAKTKPKPKPTPEKNPIEVPLYTLWDVARYLRVPLGVASILSGRFREWPEIEFLFHPFWRHSGQLSHFDDDGAFLPGDLENQHRISFRRFADLFVRAGVFAAMVQWQSQMSQRSEERERLSRTIWRGLEDTSLEAVPFDASPVQHRAERIASRFVGSSDEAQALLIQKHLMIRLERVETDGDLPVRLYPPTRDPAEESPRTIVIDPRIRFGRPVISGRGVPTDSIFERYLAGDSVGTLAKDYGITQGEGEEAIRYESRPPVALFPFPGW